MELLGLWIDVCITFSETAKYLSRLFVPFYNPTRNIQELLHLLLFFFFFLAAVGLRCGAGATPHCSAWSSHCGGFSCCRARALGMWASVVVAHGLSSCGSRAIEYRLSSCGEWAYLLGGMWDLPGPGLEPVSLHWQVVS